MDEESQPLLHSIESNKSIQNGRSAWKYLAIGAGLISIGLFAVSLDGRYFPSGAERVAAKRIQLAKDGLFGYAALNDNERATLWDEFKENFDRKVS